MPRTLLASAAVVTCAVLSLAASAAAQEDGQPEVTAAVQVTDKPYRSRGYSSPHMAVNPTNGELVIVTTDINGGNPVIGGDEFQGTRKCEIYISTNGGRSWFEGGDPMVEPYTECSRVAVNGPYGSPAFAADGTLYVAFTASDAKWANPHPPETIPRHVFLARSGDGGRSFQTTLVQKGLDEPVDPPAQLPPSSNNTRAMLAVDPTTPSRVYVGWSGVGTAEEKSTTMIAASDDGGRTFGEPIDLSGERGGTQARPAVDGDGTVHVVYSAGTFGTPRDQPVSRPVLYRRSSDFGKTWSAPKEIDRGNQGFAAGRKWQLAADPSSGALYVVWYGNPKVDFDPATDDLDILLRVSIDGGETWSEPRVVNDDADRPRVHHYDPGISIAPNGRVDVAWYDFRNSPVPEGEGPYGFNAGGFQDVYYAFSNDQGRTFSESARITDRIIDRTIGIWSNNVHSHDTVGIASTEDAAYFAWQDSRNGNADTNAEDVYFASFLFDAEAAAAVPARRFPVWLLLVAVGVLGMGLAMIVAAVLARRIRPRQVPVPARGGGTRAS